MSKGFLCDLCAKQAGSIEMGNWCCLAPGMAAMTYKRRKAIEYGQDDPHAVCRHFETREGA